MSSMILSLLMDAVVCECSHLSEWKRVVIISTEVYALILLWCSESRNLGKITESMCYRLLLLICIFFMGSCEYCSTLLWVSIRQFLQPPRLLPWDHLCGHSSLQLHLDTVRKALGEILARHCSVHSWKKWDASGETGSRLTDRYGKPSEHQKPWRSRVTGGEKRMKTIYYVALIKDGPAHLPYAIPAMAMCLYVQRNGEFIEVR